ncbi:MULTISPECIES: hypothetical protein [Wolbachia]|uniref:hypothetical protein n=1 Tax=Wolbachia TaxID=953 RepID=UPI0015FA8C5E|nr:MULTISPECIES: hypothetical protein [Wolbachia]MBA8757119.1 hypothetical protein [Wolbachia pipientis]MDE5058952.1 hypothetical protein [Wolbachia endosymbiont of Drosophila baimaii]
MDIKELVNVFNLNNYFSERINTNFTVEGRKIVGLFADDTDVAEYLHRIGEEIIKQQYSSREVAGRYYNLNYFPFVLGANPNKKKSNIKGVMEVKLADSANREVIHNLKIHLVNEFRRAVILKLIARLQKAVGITEEKAHEWIGETFRIGAIGKSFSYLCCIAFSDEYLKRRYDSETFELLKGEYIKEFNSRLRECGLKRSDFYDNRGDMLYIKNVSDKVVKSIAEYVKGRIALDFETLGEECSKVENFKDVFSSLIFKHTEKFVDAYGDDIFVDEGEIGSGNSFVLIPLTKTYDGQLESLKHKDAYKINAVYNKKLVSDIRGKTAKPHVTNCQNPVYAISNKGIAQLLPIIMRSPIKYNTENKCFEFAVDLENFRRRDSIRGSQSSSTVTSPLNSPTHAGPSGLRTPPNQRDRDSGYDSNSPPKPKDSGSSSGGPSSGLTELSSPTQEFPERGRSQGAVGRPPRQGSEREEETGRMFQLVPGEIDPSQSTGGQSQLSLGAGEGMLTEDNIPDQKRSSSIPSPIAWDDSTFLNPEVSNEEPEKQQVTKEKEEEKLFKALLYWFNLNNYALDPPHTNFIVKNGKIASLIDDGVDVKEYLQEIIDKTKEEYRVNKEEAYDLNEFPFQFLSNCEKNQETTVVANISRGALLNLKELFSREHEGKVEIKDIDINIVEKAVKSEKDKWVNFQVQEHGLSPKKAIKTCYPDESVLEYISITKDEGGYWINRDYDGSEVESFRKEQWPAKGTSKAEKMKSEDNKDSGYSSGFVTDAENVSSKAEATTSGYESMDCENTRGGSPKRALELSVGMEELTISTDLYATKAEQHSPIKKFRSN